MFQKNPGLVLSVLVRISIICVSVVRVTRGGHTRRP